MAAPRSRRVAPVAPANTARHDHTNNNSLLSPSSPNGVSASSSSSASSAATAGSTSQQRNGIRVAGVGGASWALLAAALLLHAAILVSCALHAHWRVPTPRSIIDAGGETSPPQFSEALARIHIDKLVSEIGMRVVGTQQEHAAREYLVNQLLQLKAINDNRGLGRSVENFEIDVQVADGSHRFDLMGFPVLKTYANITNIVVKLSCGIHCDNNGAILMNSHYDSTIVSPGAADDGAGVAIMLEVIRILVHRAKTPQHKLKNALVLLFNGAEETLQDASHAFVTQHTLAKNVRGVINLEAMGQVGREILFQANSLEMIKAYSHVPYPHGSVLSNDVFRTGLVLSDTDFRQFVEYGNYVGLDLAFYQNSYYYHTMHDVVENIGEGSIQNFGENVMAMLDYLLYTADAKDITLDNTIIYFDILGTFFFYAPWSTAVQVYCVVLAIAIAALVYSLRTESSQVAAFLQSRAVAVKGSSPQDQHIVTRNVWRNAIKARFVAVFAYTIGLILSILLNVGLSLFAYLINRRMTWFSREYYPIVFYFASSLLAVITPHYFVRRYIISSHERLFSFPQNIYTERCKRVILERACFDACLINPAILLVIAIFMKLGSSYLLCIYLLSISLASFGSTFICAKAAPALRRLSVPSAELSVLEVDTALKRLVPPIPIISYFATTFPLLFTTELVICITNLFTPITGRIGPDAPTDIIIGVIMSILLNVVSYAVVPLMYRMPRRYTWTVIKHVAIAAILIPSVFFVFIRPFDIEHPKRIYVSYTENPDTGERRVNVAHADPVMIREVLDSMSVELGSRPVLRTTNETDSDWLSLYPFSHFLEGYSFDVSHLAPISPPMAELPQLELHTTVPDKNTGLRTVSVDCKYPNYMWVVFKIDADIVDWSLKDTTVLTPGKRNTYMVRSVAGYGVDRWQWSFTVNETEPVPVTLLAVETAGFHELIDIRAGLAGIRKVGRGMQWMWSDRWGSAEVLSRVEHSAPRWTTGLYVAEVQLSRTA